MKQFILWTIRNWKTIMTVAGMAWEYWQMLLRKFKNNKLKKNKMAKLGIEKLKRDLSILAAIVMEWDSAKADGRIKIFEWAKIGIKSVKLVEVLKSIEQAKREFLDLDGAEKEEIQKHFVEVFDLRNDEAEEMIEELVVMAFGLGGVLSVLDKKNETQKQ